jgi:hypothetical protein
VKSPTAGTLLICGDRNWKDYDLILMMLRTLPRDTKVIHGGCRGADRMAGQAAKYLGMKVKVFPALWMLQGKAAGPLRNQRMLDKGKPGMVWAFHNHIERSKGTKDMVERAKEAGITVVIHTIKEG